MSKMKPRSLRSKCFSPGKGSWYDPEQLGLKVILALLYMAGLVSFQRYTGLLNTPSSSSISSTTKIHSSEEALHWLRNYDINSGHSRLIRSLMALPEEANGTDFLSSNSSTNSTNGTMIEINQADPLFPPDLFTMEQIKGGYVAFYIVGVVYMFVALAIVCDEFFVPSLDVIIEQIGCSEDVAGATFMAAGGSAPELFTSVIGVFIAFSDVGIGTIVGSAVFNILFVIGMCALFSKTVLCLTWWPLLRDCTFYSISLLTLIAFFLDERIEMYEAAILLAIYGFYVFFMKYNVKAEVGFKRLIGANKVHETQLMNNTSNGQGHIGYSGVPVLHSGSHFHHGLLQLMIHTIDPLSEGGSQSRVNEKAAQLHAIASIQSILGSAAAGGMAPADGVNGNNPRNTSTNLGPELSQFDAFTNADQLSQIGVTMAEPVKSQANADLNGLNVAPMEEEEESEPLDMSWPDTWSKRLSYVLVLPLILPMWITLPDTRKPNLRGFYPITFIGSILWIAVFSYLMVWWSTITGEAFSIPPEVMGLTFLAAGTSIPDLFTSVIVARKGFGDMAVSSSVGSNIFDVTVGLPLPWLLYTLVFQKDVAVSAAGLVCSVTILFMMLIAVFLSILLFSWKMTKTMGLSMFVFYFLFVIATLGFEYDFYECPF